MVIDYNKYIGTQGFSYLADKLETKLGYLVVALVSFLGSFYYERPAAYILCAYLLAVNLYILPQILRLADRGDGARTRGVAYALSLVSGLIFFLTIVTATKLALPAYIVAMTLFVIWSVTGLSHTLERGRVVTFLLLLLGYILLYIWPSTYIVQRYTTPITLPKEEFRVTAGTVTTSMQEAVKHMPVDKRFIPAKPSLLIVNGSLISYATLPEDKQVKLRTNLQKSLAGVYNGNFTTFNISTELQGARNLSSQVLSEAKYSLTFVDFPVISRSGSLLAVYCKGVLSTTTVHATSDREVTFNVLFDITQPTDWVLRDFQLNSYK